MIVPEDAKQLASSNHSRRDLAFERSVLANPAAHTYGAVSMAGKTGRSACLEAVVVPHSVRIRNHAGRSRIRTVHSNKAGA
jgi:hypothetical protein